MKRFEIIDISGDAGIRVYGETIEDLFVNAAAGMYSLITDLEKIIEKKEILINVESHSIEGLLVSWLNELIFHFDAYGFMGKKVVISELSELSPPVFLLKATVSGEDFDPERHERRLLLKAATYHQLSIEKKDGLWVTNVILDI